MTAPTTGHDTWRLGDKELSSRLVLAIPEEADTGDLDAVLEASGAGVATLRTAPVEPGRHDLIAETLRRHDVLMLPNTAGCANADEAVRAAEHGAELSGIRWVKLILTNDGDHQIPEPVEMYRAARELVDRGFQVFPNASDDPGYAADLERAGCAGVFPQGSPVGSGQGLIAPLKFRLMVERLGIPVVIGAGIGRHADAFEAMELGCAAVASAKVVFEAADRPAAAAALAAAVRAGRQAHLGSRAAA
ncbi:hypothetical protein [Actinomadura hibisca]|uniref:hypothetical protein n=1 Tax=Actinomadura hibisca TaxID=68565 RepID=UPI000830DC85|nr:hypothetical protein [Actinomadura hibisca]